ncbi:MAG: hypothetical protein MZV63_32960 [Marinilabiliales bacterium]|nr:hypothetical protein [Marinilabiliales bacterium]
MNMIIRTHEAWQCVPATSRRDLRPDQHGALTKRQRSGKRADHLFHRKRTERLRTEGISSVVVASLVKSWLGITRNRARTELLKGNHVYRGKRQARAPAI